MTKVIWKSSDTSVATVDSDGTVKGIKVGTTTITATAHGFNKICKVKVNAPTFSIGQDSILIHTGYSTKITAKSTPVTKVAWKSSNSSIASVDSEGKVTGKKVGKATITATAHGIEQSCKVTVKLPTLTVLESKKSIKVGKKATITATATPNTTIQQYNIVQKHLILLQWIRREQ